MGREGVREGEGREGGREGREGQRRGEGGRGWMDGKRDGGESGGREGGRKDGWEGRKLLETLMGTLGTVVYYILIDCRWFAGPLVNMPLDAPRVVSEEWRNGSEYGERLWGTYRSNVYFGVRPRLPQ